MNLARTARTAALSVLMAIGTFATVTAMAVGLQGCAWFDKHVEPVIKPIVTCAGQSVSAADFQEAVNDLRSKDYGDLAQMGIRLGWDVLACIVDNIGTQDPSLKTNGTEFKAQHAKQIQAAQAPSVSLRSPGDATPKTGPKPVAEYFSYAGDNTGAALTHCYRACGDNTHGAIAPPGGCDCWRKVGTTWRWVALRSSPPTGRVGVVGGGGAVVASSR